MRAGRSLLALCGSALVGCAGPVAGDASGDADAASTTAVVTVERTADGAGTRAEASARFVRLPSTSSTSLALRAIGASVELPAPGACVTTATLRSDVGADDPAPVVELVEVGAVSLESGAGAEARLAPRQLPDVTDVVSGVVYARAADSALLPADARYVLHVAGSSLVPAFDVAAQAPSDAVRVSGEDDAGRVVIGDKAPDVTWAGDARSDVVYVDVQPAGVRCQLAVEGDAGGGRAPLPTAVLGDAGSLTVHRLHRESFAAKGLDSGEIRFDFARLLSYVRR